MTALHAALPTLPANVWRGSDLGATVTKACTSGWPELDAQLPGGGWPARSLTELLAPQATLLEIRLAGAALRQVRAAGGQVILVGPPKHPHLPGLVHAGLDAKHVTWVRAETPAERLWVTEQIIKSNSAGAVMAWLPHARQEQIRRLQVCALACEAPVFLCRPEGARNESSAAPLRLHASAGLDWELLVEVFKRRGPVHAGVLHLPSVPGGLEAVLTPRMRTPSALLRAAETRNGDALGSTASRTRPVQHLATH